MKKGALALAVCAIAITGAVVVSSSSGAKAGKGPYQFYSGVFVIDQASVARVYVENPTNSPVSVKVQFAGEDTDQLTVTPGGTASAVSNTCAQVTCQLRAKVLTRSPLIVPSLRYGDTDGAVQEDLAGDFIVIRDGKRVW